MDFAKAFDPPNGQLHFAFDNFVVVRSQRDTFATNLQLSVVVIRQPPQSRSHGVIKIDVRCAFAAEIRIKCFRCQVDPSIDTAAATKAFEPQHASAAGHNRIEHHRVEGLIEAGANDRRQNRQALPDESRLP
ncbi:hypothetical protein [Stieleria maiorica]|uniref:hypothetical protein n=1 Tax=Stieleria maiorica TaxID=2795974 RepID=UPI00142F3776|nr:hypothetical protein [Stieleria maiorica]